MRSIWKGGPVLTEVFTAVLAITGCLFLLLAAIGLLRMPDLFMRMSASSKAVSLGVGLLLIALAVHFQNKDVTAKSVLVIAFFLLKAPVAAHVLARAAYRIGVSLWKETIVDELRGYYDQPPPFPETGEVRPERRERHPPDEEFHV